MRPSPACKNAKSRPILLPAFCLSNIRYAAYSFVSAFFMSGVETHAPPLKVRITPGALESAVVQQRGDEHDEA